MHNVRRVHGGRGTFGAVAQLTAPNCSEAWLKNMLATWLISDTAFCPDLSI